MKHILVVDDEENIREIVSAYLRKEGYQVSQAKDGLEAIDLFNSREVDLLVLDRMMPNMSGDEVCARIRSKSRVPIIMLTAKVSQEDIIDGIAGGADDYIRKPFSVRELMVRIHALLRRSDTDLPMSDIMTFGDGDLYIDFKRMVFKKEGEAITLTPNEFKILKMLIVNEGIVLNREQIIEKSFGIQFDGFDRTIDTHIKNLRQKLEDDPKKPIYIRTIYSMGYKFVAN